MTSTVYEVQQRRTSAERRLRAAYENLDQMTGWPMRLEPQAGRIYLVTGVDLDAITMPASLAERVLIELRIAVQACPVVAAPGGEWWTFVTGVADAPHPALPASLTDLRVLLAPRGACTVLAGGDPPDSWSWANPPGITGEVPAWASVVAAARYVASR